MPSKRSERERPDCRHAAVVHITQREAADLEDEDGFLNGVKRGSNCFNLRLLITKRGHIPNNRKDRELVVDGLYRAQADLRCELRTVGT